MSKLAIRLLTLAVYAAALAAVPAVTPAKAGASSSRHIKKHKRHKQPRLQRSLVCRSGAGCCQAFQSGRPSLPGHRRSFDCKTWPPPMEDDPDRKISGSDGG